MVITDLGVFTIDKQAARMSLIELAPGVTVAEINAVTGADFRVALEAANATAQSVHLHQGVRLVSGSSGGSIRSVASSPANFL
jgi:hypothetical protein